MNNLLYNTFLSLGCLTICQFMTVPCISKDIYFLEKAYTILTLSSFLFSFMYYFFDTKDSASVVVLKNRYMPVFCLISSIFVTPFVDIYSMPEESQGKLLFTGVLAIIWVMLFFVMSAIALNQFRTYMKTYTYINEHQFNMIPFFISVYNIFTSDGVGDLLKDPVMVLVYIFITGVMFLLSNQSYAIKISQSLPKYHIKESDHISSLNIPILISDVIPIQVTDIIGNFIRYIYINGIAGSPFTDFEFSVISNIGCVMVWYIYNFLSFRHSDLLNYLDESKSFIIDDNNITEDDHSTYLSTIRQYLNICNVCILFMLRHCTNVLEAKHNINILPLIVFMNDTSEIIHNFLSDKVVQSLDEIAPEVF